MLVTTLGSWAVALGLVGVASSEPAPPPTPSPTDAQPTADVQPTVDPDAESGLDAGLDAGTDATVDAVEGGVGESDEETMSLEDIFGPARPPSEDLEGGASPGPADPAGVETAPHHERKRPWGLPRTEKLRLNLRILSSLYYAVLPSESRGIERNENRLEFRLAYRPGPHIELVGDIQPVFFGTTTASTLDDLTQRSAVTPFHLESDAAYVAIYDLLPNLDVKLGRQIVQWGTADKFNPTNNINADDLEDRPLFTEPIANQMVVIDWAPLQDRLYFQGVYVPLFTPAMLPPSASAALTDPYGPVPFARQSDRDKIDAARALFEIDPGLIPTVDSTLDLPRFRLRDGQFAAKVGTNFGGVFDLSLSYYYGRHDIPTPVQVDSAFKEDPAGDPGTPECCVQSLVTLTYPRMQVIGLDFATQLEFLGNMGLWGEGALFFPEAEDLRIEFPVAQDVTDDGQNDPVTFVEGPSIESTPYVKVTAGLDYTFGKHVYVQAQYLRGFIDEIGASHIGNYVVAGTELAFVGRQVLVRLFGVMDVPTGSGDDGSYVIYPALMLKPPWGYVTLELGSFFLLGKEDTKFGQKAAGSSLVFGKVVGAF